MAQIEAEKAIEAIAAIIANLAESPSEYYSQYTSPLGKRRHLEAVRRGELPAFKSGRLRLVKREVMHLFIEKNPTRASHDPSVDADEQLIEELNKLKLDS